MLGAEVDYSVRVDIEMWLAGAISLMGVGGR